MKYKNPCATADIIVERNNKILLTRRKYPPFKGCWALPGGFLDYGKETLEEAATRELEEETGLKTKTENLRLLGVYSDPKRDPRGHVITHTYITNKFKGRVNAGDDAAESEWFPLDNLPKLAFDHDKAIKDYLSWRRNR